MAGPKKISAKVSEIRDHRDGVRTLILELDRRAPLFKPGQFLHLAIDHYDPSMHWPESRVFSICSPPESRNKIQIVFSKIGCFTSRMLELKVGETVWLKFPYGDFVIQSDPEFESILIAGGTGIAPFMSWIWSNQDVESAVQLVYGVRSPSHLIFEKDLEASLDRNSLRRWVPFIESGSRPGAVHGRLNVDDIFEQCEIVERVEKCKFYLSGPPQMIANIKMQLIDKSVSEQRIIIDDW